MANKSNSFKFAVVALGTLFGPISCSSDSADTTNDDGGTPTTTGPSTTGTTTATVGGTTTGGTVSTTAANTTGNVTVATTATASTTGSSTTGSGTTGSSTTGSATTASNTTSGTTTGTATSSGAGGTSSTGSMSGAGGTSTTGGGEDFEPTAEDFGCVADQVKVSGFRVTNALGEAETAASIAVAQNPEGAVFPVGTILQHLPTEAMVKRGPGFSPETKDWEFFLLDIASGTTTISQRGTTELTTMGDTCVSCHSLVPDEYDFVCNTWGDAGGDCGFDFQDSMLDQQAANDPRCD